MKMKTNRLTFSALLISVMLVLGYIESMIPMPGVPGMKIGLSNAVLMLALYWLGAADAFILMGAKVLLSGLLFGGVSAMMYSFAGGLASMLVMTLLVYLIPKFSPIGVGVAGAVMHNVGQVALAMLILQTTGLAYYLALLLLAAVATGTATGVVTGLLMKRIPAAVRDEVKKR